MKLNFSIFKNTYKEEGSNQPDYTCSVYDSETKKSTKIGGGWIKEGKNGKYISVSLDDEYKPAPKTDYPDGDVKPEDIPF